MQGPSRMCRVPVAGVAMRYLIDRAALVNASPLVAIPAIGPWGMGLHLYRGRPAIATRAVSKHEAPGPAGGVVAKAEAPAGAGFGWPASSRAIGYVVGTAHARAVPACKQ